MKTIHKLLLGLSILFLYFFSDPYILASTGKAEKVAFKTKDGVTLKALFFKPDGGKPVAILLHGLASTKEEWNPFADYLAKQGWGVLAYDARGHGASSKTKDMNGAPNGFQYFGKPGPGTQWERMIDDIGGAMAFIKVDQKLDDRPIFLCGASLGANVALKYAALARSIKAAVLLSPGMNFAEFHPEDPIQHLRDVSVLMVASQSDQYSYESCIRLSKLAPGVPFWSDVKAGHGVQMLDETLNKRIFDWLDKQK